MVTLLLRSQFPTAKCHCNGEVPVLVQSYIQFMLQHVVSSYTMNMFH